MSTSGQMAKLRRTAGFLEHIPERPQGSYESVDFKR